jgi:cobalt/nickel transport system permease protein
MRLARELRAGLQSAGPGGVGTLLGHLLVRSIDRAQRIHLAMLARGFDGGLPLGPAGLAHWRDSAGLALCLAALALARHVDLVQLLGRTLARALA